MTLEKFNSQSLNQRTETVLAWGYFVAQVRTAKVNTVLFSVNGFFAEMKMRISDNVITGIKAYSVEELPLEYFSMINTDNPFLVAAVPEFNMAHLALVA